MFYKSENDELLGGSMMVIGPTFELYEHDKDRYEYPIEGWYWFDTEEQARIFFNLPEPKLEPGSAQE